MPACSPRRLPILCACSAQCSVNEDDTRIARVDARDELRQLRPLGRPLGALHDPDEEVGREEGPEDHDLGDDEKQHPEVGRVHPRGAVGRRRPVVLVLVVAGRRGRRLPSGLHRRSARLDVLDGLAGRLLRRAPRACRRPTWTCGSGQRRDDDLRDVEVLAPRSSSRCRGPGRRSCPPPRSRRRRARRAACARRSRAALTARPSPSSCGTTMMNRCGPSAASSSSRSTSSPPGDGLVGHHERHVEREPVALEVDHDVVDRQPGLGLERLDEVAPDPGRGLRAASRR